MRFGTNEVKQLESPDGPALRSPRARSGRMTAKAALVAVLAVVAAMVGALPAGAVTHSQINGAGSTWAGNALDAWIGEVSAQGLRVTFTGTGSAQGRQNFAQGTVDFGVSDIGYQGVDSRTGQSDTSNRPYAFVPLVAGGTSFPYHITVRGQLVTGLRLSGQTLAKIFTDQITNWDDPAITSDNNGQALPSIPIVPIVHSEGSGTTYQFSAYLVHDFPSIWSSFSGLSAPTEYWPSGKGQQIAQNGSDGVMNYVGSAAGQGTITFDEYSYALAKGFPVVKVENSAGYFTLPTQYNVAVALTQAIINTDKSDPSQYLLQDLHNVYDYSDPRTYPLSSYSYGIIPTSSTDATMTTGKRQTLADFLYNSICQGQASVGGIGYSALPLNLVQAGFNQIALLSAADPNVDLTNESVTTCGNPTFVSGNLNANHLAQIAPQPASCDQQGQGPCGVTNVSTSTQSASPSASSSSSSSSTTTGTTTTTETNTTSTGGTSATSTGGTSSTSTGKAATGGSSSTGKAATGGSSSTGKTTTGGGTTGGATGGSGTTPGGTTTGGSTPTGSQAPQVDPITGLLIGTTADQSGNSGNSGNSGASGGTAANGGSGTTNVTYAATNVSAGQGMSPGLSALAAVLVLGALIAPPYLARRWRRSNGRSL
jgi:phosphate transport system substrate-binding protein